MSKAPAFQLFAQDFFMDTIEWSVDEVGIYWRLLQAQWINGSIPNDEERLARIAGCGPKKFSSGWKKVESKFKLNGDGRLQNERLERTRDEQEQYRESQAESGRRGVEAKRKKGIFPFDKSSDPLTDPSSDSASENQALQSSSSIKIKERNIKERNPAIQLRENVSLTQDEINALMGRFAANQLQWMYDKLNFHLSTTTKKYKGCYGFFNSGSWLIEEMEKKFIGMQEGISGGTPIKCKGCGVTGVYINDEGYCAVCESKDTRGSK